MMNLGHCALRCLFVVLLLAAQLDAAPNVLFIAIDDQNDWIGCLGGHPQVKTPNIDRLASRGVLFTNAHCQSPLCNPSRTSVLTGLRPSTTGVYSLSPWFRTLGAFASRATLMQHFQRNGYRTLTTGKIFHDAYPPMKERDNEVDVWGFHGGHKPFPPQKFVKTPDNITLMDWGVHPDRDEVMDDTKVADWAIEQLQGEHKQPFFLGVGFRHPHVPCYAPQKWFDLYPDASLIMPSVKADDRDDLPRFASYLHWKLPEPRLDWLQRAQQWRPLVRAYLASISYMDHQLGRVLDALDKAKLADNTIVVVWSDHGWHLGEKGITGKNTLWDCSTRVPLIFAGPSVVRGGKCSRPAELLDMYPTLSELCNLPAVAGLEGHSLAAQLKDPTAPREWPAITTHNHDNHGVRSERWRYIRYADGSEELYDLQADPNEWTNLAKLSEHEGVKRELARWMPRTSAPPAPGSKARLLEYRDGVAVWEGKVIDPLAALPE